MTDIDCERCDNRGWWLEDARVVVCDCERLDPPKWVKRGDVACILTHGKDAERPRRAAVGFVCAGHHSKIERLLAEMPFRYDELGLALTSSERPDHDGHNKGKSTSTGVALNERVLEDRRDIHDELVRMVRETVEATITAEDFACLACGVKAGLGCLAEMTHEVRENAAQLERLKASPADDINAMSSWLLSRLDWFCEQPNIDETHDNLDRLSRSAWRLAYPSGRQRVEIGLCGEGECPGTLWLTGTADEGRTMACDDCKRLVEPRYWRRERRRIDGVDVNPWLTLSEAAAQYGCTTRTMERWVAKGRLKARGSPMRVKASAVESLMQAFTNRCA